MSDTVKVVTNNVPREIIDGYSLTATERAEFDYLDWKAIEDGSDSASFFRYKGQLYDIDEFQPLSKLTSAPFNGWHGYLSDSYFSGLLIRFPNIADFETVIVGRYTS